MLRLHATTSSKYWRWSTTEGPGAVLAGGGRDREVVAARHELDVACEGRSRTGADLERGHVRDALLSGAGVEDAGCREHDPGRVLGM
jgi:hypothetical protein